ncbi:MAG: spore coat protein CotJB [Traorella sp.]
MRRTDEYFDFDDRFDEEDRFRTRDILRSRSILNDRERDCDCDDEDFDFCEENCETRDKNCRERDRDDCRCREKDRDDCQCHDKERDEERCRCNLGIDGDCCEEMIHCSDFKDFNEDERFGCRTREDAAQSEDSWFECQSEECCTRCRELCDEEKSFCKKLKCRIQVLDFILQETILFLDTHPCDFEALRYYRIVRRKLERLERIYERKCGPLTNKGVDTEFGWEWACCPWPWEGKD